MDHSLFSTGVIFAAGGLQLAVACYALRLNRLFGTSRVGWSLFAAFALLALIHGLPIFAPLLLPLDAASVADLLYAVVSLLLFTSMIHIEFLLKERKKLETRECQLRAELELEVKKKTAYLLQAIEGLQAEMEERKRMAEEIQCLKSVSTTTWQPSPDTQHIRF